ncbi:MAG: hypothetical protein NTX56_07340 [Proteobacteria bacterium]|nr:hypothetical protein [Pseudomonadota bacterium]
MSYRVAIKAKGGIQIQMRTGCNKRIDALVAAFIAVLFLVGCAGPSSRKVNETKVGQFSGQGYLTDDQFSIDTTEITSAAGPDRFDHELTIPTKVGLYPLVIYIPALGETHTAGASWRSAWAKAGYAVVSIQPLPEDAVAWSSARARMGDFSSLARERYSAKAMAARIEAVRLAIMEVVRRHDAAKAPFDRMDLSRVTLAGYDLGAYTSMAIAGERIRGVNLVSFPLPVKAVIAISPYADFAGVAFTERYSDINVPVLSITSVNDTDSLGLVVSPTLRKAPFEYMPNGQKYLLTMADVAHTSLAGNEIRPTAEDSGASEKAAPLNNGPGDGGHSGGHGKGGGKTNGSNSNKRGNRDPQISSGGRRSSPTLEALGISAIQGVTTAFLDACVKDDPIAREWLRNDAPRWIREQGEIKEK